MHLCGWQWSGSTQRNIIHIPTSLGSLATVLVLRGHHEARKRMRIQSHVMRLH